jgi:hypothetical protein
MSIITISRGSYSKGKEIAEKTAALLGHKCISRDILLEASAHFNIPEVKLIRAIHDAPSILERFKYGKEKYIAFIREAFFERIIKDNVVYHGLGGHFFLRGIPNILKVRIIANIEDRVKEEMKRENISEKDARLILTKDDEERRKWSMYLYGVDTKDASLYDLVLHIDTMKVDDAVKILVEAAKMPCFQSSAESKSAIRDAYLVAKAQAALFDKFPSANIVSHDAVVYVRIETVLSLEDEVTTKIKEILSPIKEIKDVRVNIVPMDTSD